MEIGAPLGRGPLFAARGEDLREEIAEGGRVVAAAAGEIEPLEAAGPTIVSAERRTGVVAGATLRIDQRLVGLQNLAEPRLSRAIARIDVGMKPAREAPVRALDLQLRRAVLEPEDDVEIHVAISDS